jgi:hypothetical protein
MEISRVTASAPSTISLPASVRTSPPLASARARAWNLTAPGRPCHSPLVPSSAMVRRSTAVEAELCGLVNAASNDTEPGRSAVSRTTITWSGLLANTSREYRTPPLR